MFSGLTNQVTSWIGAAKGDPQDEEVPPPTNQTAAAPAAASAVPLQSETVPLDQTSLGEQLQEQENQPVAEGEDPDKKQSPTKAGGGMFSNVKSQMTGWLGNASIPSMPSMPSIPAMPSIPSIPGLRKGGAGGEGEMNAEGAQPIQGGELGASSNAAAGGAGEGVNTGEEEDRSSATEGADSHSGSGGGTPTDDQAGQIGNVTTKVTQGAKTFGSFLYSAVNKAGAKIKETVKDNSILGEFNKEQEAFIKDQAASKIDASIAPWIGHNNEEKVKEEILILSQDRRNFVRAPPAGVDFQFDYDVSYPIALAIMSEDSALEKMRFDLVPKIITEEHFWRNYFYRVSLICKAAEMGTLGGDGSILGQQSSGEEAKETEAINVNEKKKKQKLSESEFISDKFYPTETDVEEVKEGIKKLGIDSMVIQQETENEEQWEKDLEAELQEYEVVNDGTSSSNNNNNNNNTFNNNSDNRGGDTGGGGGGGSDNIPASTSTRIRSSSSNNDWEQYADLIDETDDLK